MAVANTLAYYDMATITAVKGPWAQYYKTFLVRDLRIFLVS